MPLIINTAQKWLADYLHYDVHASVQFIKYGVAGGLATLVYTVVFVVLNETVFPADVSQAAEVRGFNFFWSNAFAFCLANIFAYLANRRWVFRPGRHNRFKEIGLFYLVAVLAFFMGTPLGALIVTYLSINEYFAYLLVIVISVGVNFFGRKYLVFKG